MNKIIWVDLDEVLAETFDYIFKYYDNKLNWELVEKNLVTHVYICNIPKYNISYEESIEWYRKALIDDINLEVKPVSWAKEILKKHKKLWFRFKVITARSQDLFYQYSKDWLDKCFKDIFEEIIFANHDEDNRKDKSQICREHWIETMIEDNPDYALELAENWIKTFLLEKTWNKYINLNSKNIIRVKNWKDIIL